MRTQGGNAMSTPTIKPLVEQTDAELLELYQQISGRVARYNTEVLIERMFEIRRELDGRLTALRARLATTEQELTNYKLGFASQTEERIAAEQRSEDLAATLNSVLVCFCGPITTSGCEPVHIANVKGSDLHRWRNILLGKST